MPVHDGPVFARESIVFQKENSSNFCAQKGKLVGIQLWNDVGFEEIHAWRANAHDGRPGTLAILGKRA